MLVTGLEPAFTVPFTVTCSVDKPDYTSIKAGASRFEQEITDLETVVLPLTLCIYILEEVSEVGFEPTWDFSSRLRVCPSQPNFGNSPINERERI